MLSGIFCAAAVVIYCADIFNFKGFIVDPWGNKRFGAEASLVINRQDFGVKWNKTLDGGGLLVGNDVTIELEVEAIKAQEGTN